MGKKILIVDDEDVVRDFLKCFFENRGYEVAVAGDGAKAFELVAVFKPEVVLLDIQMPGMDGLQALKQIKGVYPQVKVIMVTGVGAQAKIEEAKRLGADNYITKPLNLACLEKDVREKIELFSKDS